MKTKIDTTKKEDSLNMIRIVLDELEATTLDNLDILEKILDDSMIDEEIGEIAENINDDLMKFKKTVLDHGVVINQAFKDYL